MMNFAQILAEASGAVAVTAPEAASAPMDTTTFLPDRFRSSTPWRISSEAAALPLQATIVIANMMLQSIGRGLKASITSSARSGIFFIPLILVLPEVFGLLGVEMTQAIADILSVSVSIPLAASELKKMERESR